MALKFPGSESKSEKTKKIKGLKKDQLVILLLFGILLVVIAIPTSPGEVSSENTAEEDGTQTEAAAAGEDGTTGQTYEQRQEQRLKEALQLVEGVGKVEVMITLEAGSELVVEKDQPVTSQTVEETDSDGGSRSTTEESWSESTVYSEGERQPLPLCGQGAGADGAGSDCDRGRRRKRRGKAGYSGGRAGIISCRGT